MSLYIKIFVFLLLASCLREKKEGLILEQEDIEKITLGQSVEEVQNIMGTPSFRLKGANNGTILVYASSVKQWRAFTIPEVISSKTLELKFNNQKLVKINIITETDNTLEYKIQDNIFTKTKVKD